jgi:hypothetical protein
MEDSPYKSRKSSYEIADNLSNSASKEGVVNANALTQLQGNLFNSESLEQNSNSYAISGGNLMHINNTSKFVLKNDQIKLIDKGNTSAVSDRFFDAICNAKLITDIEKKAYPIEIIAEIHSKLKIGEKESGHARLIKIIVDKEMKISYDILDGSSLTNENQTTKEFYENLDTTFNNVKNNINNLKKDIAQDDPDDREIFPKISNTSYSEVFKNNPQVEGKTAARKATNYFSSIPECKLSTNVDSKDNKVFLNLDNKGLYSPQNACRAASYGFFHQYVSSAIKGKDVKYDKNTANELGFQPMMIDVNGVAALIHYAGHNKETQSEKKLVDPKLHEQYINSTAGKPKSI